MTTTQMVASEKFDSRSSSQSSPICLFPNLVSQHPQSLIVETKATSTAVYDSASQAVLRIESRFFSLSHRKNVHDKDVTNLFTIHKDFIHPNSARYYFEDPISRAQILDLRTTWTGYVLKIIATFVNPLSGQKEVLQVDGDSTTIVAQDTKRVLAQFGQKTFAVKQQYPLTVMPDVDVALVVGILMCSDDLRANTEIPKNVAGVSVHVLAKG